MYRLAKKMYSLFDRQLKMYDLITLNRCRKILLVTESMIMSWKCENNLTNSFRKFHRRNITLLTADKNVIPTFVRNVLEDHGYPPTNTQ